MGQSEQQSNPYQIIQLITQVLEESDNSEMMEYFIKDALADYSDQMKEMSDQELHNMFSLEYLPHHYDDPYVDFTYPEKWRNAAKELSEKLSEL